MLRSGGRTSLSVSGRMKDRPYSTSLMLLTSAKVIIKFEYTMKEVGFTIQTQQNEVGTELFGNYMNSEGWLRIWNSNISKTVYLLEFIFPKGDFNTVYEHYIGLKNVLLGIYGKPTEVLEDKPEEIFDTAWDLGVFTFATYYETEEGLITLEISEKQHRVEISFQDNINAEIMRKEKNNQ